MQVVLAAVAMMAVVAVQAAVEAVEAAVEARAVAAEARAAVEAVEAAVEARAVAAEARAVAAAVEAAVEARAVAAAVVVEATTSGCRHFVRTAPLAVALFFHPWLSRATTSRKQVPTAATSDEGGPRQHRSWMRVGRGHGARARHLGAARSPTT